MKLVFLLVYPFKHLPPLLSPPFLNLFRFPTDSPSPSSHVSSPAPASRLTCPSTEPIPSPVAPFPTMVPPAPSHTM